MGQDLAQTAQQRGRVARLGVQIAAAPEREQAPRDGGSPVRRLDGEPREAANAGLIPGAALDQRGRARDALQNVVEVVRDAAGELAKRLHALGMGGPGLRRLPCRDLPCYARLQLAAQAAQRRFGLPACGHIHVQADHAHGPSLCVADDRGLGQQPVDRSVRPHDTIIGVEPAGGVGESSFQIGHNTRPVVGVEARAPGLMVWGGAGLRIESV